MLTVVTAMVHADSGDNQCKLGMSTLRSDEVTWTAVNTFDDYNDGHLGVLFLSLRLFIFNDTSRHMCR